LGAGSDGAPDLIFNLKDAYPMALHIAAGGWSSIEGLPLSGSASDTASLPASVLLLEDNIIILLDTEDVLKELGVAVVMTATSAGEALALIDRTPPERALLDVDLGFETCFEVATRLAVLGIPFAFVTGYGDSHPIPAEFANVPRVLKPHTTDALLKVLQD
jgi:CheY-like chemotaxis protein